MTPAAKYAQLIAKELGLTVEMESLIVSAFLSGQQLGLKQAQVIVDEMFAEMNKPHASV